MCFPVNFVKFFRTPILQNVYGRLLSNNIIGRREYPFIILGDEMSPVEGFRAKITLRRKKQSLCCSNDRNKNNIHCHLKKLTNP